MKDILQKFLKEETHFERKKDRAREFLQHLMLSIMDRRNHFSKWAFVGGTCLRVVYDLRRFSEDLDFSAIHGVSPKLSLSKIAQIWSKDLTSWGFKLEVSGIKTGNVERCFIHFPGLMKELGISSDHRIKLSIRAEVDQNTPIGYKLENSVVQKNILFSVVHHDLPSLFAGKLHAVLFRPFIKGRDLYDLVWYLSKKVPVNLKFLENATVITEGSRFKIQNQEALRKMLLNKLKEISFENVRRDLEPFLDDPSELRFINRESILKQLANIEIT